MLRRQIIFQQTILDEQQLQQKADELGIGLGDLVEKLAEWFHIPKFDGCGCAQRKELFNRLRMVGWKLKWTEFQSEPTEIRVEWRNA